jgi:hypothetical protein
LSIRDSAFSDCSSLSSICIPSSVNALCQQCFYQCHSLSRVTFETGSRLARVHDSAFLRCPSLSSIPQTSALLNTTNVRTPASICALF